MSSTRCSVRFNTEIFMNAQRLVSHNCQFLMNYPQLLKCTCMHFVRNTSSYKTPRLLHLIAQIGQKRVDYKL